MRTIKALHGAIREDIDDLMTRRPLPGPAIRHLDPFLFLNHHGPQNYPPGNHGLPFGPHPHRGFETVTFILDGEIAHRDSAGHESIIHSGGVQWMTAGSGLVHSELSPAAFKKAGGPLEILQLWVNLPARLKMAKPRYVGLEKKDIPSFDIDRGKAIIDVIAGKWDGRTGPVETPTNIFLSTVALKAGARIRLTAPKGRTIFLYVVRGTLQIAGQDVRPATLAELNDDGDRIELLGKSDVIVLFGHAAPFGEPIVAQGPFVMNTREEISQAVKDYKAGKFDAVPAA